MKKILAFLIALNVALFLAVPAHGASAVYAQLSSNVDQSNTTVFMEQVDAISGMSVLGNAIIADKTGAYMVIYAPQTGFGSGCSNYYMRVNGGDVLNSNIQVCQHTGDVTTVAVGQAVIELQKGDSLTFVTSGALGIEATQPTGEPLIPSAIISIFKL